MNTTPAKAASLHTLPYNISAEKWFEVLRGLPLPILLSSGTSKHKAARFDIVTADPEFILRTHKQETKVINQRSGQVELDLSSPFSLLDKYCRLIEDDDLALKNLPFTGGAIGYFGYELLHKENGIDWSDKMHINMPDMLIGIYQWAIVIDHQEHKSYLVVRDMPSAPLERLLALIENNKEQTQIEAQPTGIFKLNSPFKSNFSPAMYQQKFTKVIEYIHAGDCYQVNLAQCFSAACQGDSWEAFTRLQKQANAPFAAYIEDGEQAVLSFSPERFIQVSDLNVITQPIKGTRPRSADPAQDLKNKLELETSTKDRAENLMIVDLLRNDLGRVCSFGSVSVENLFETQSFTNVHHLVSTIKGKLEKSPDVFNLLEASFPGGSITGTPKLRAMEIINELETMPRSVYCGAIAWIDVRGNMDSNICIRTLVKDGDKIHCWGGGGVVADSNGDEEYQETLDKISMLINNL